MHQRIKSMTWTLLFGWHAIIMKINGFHVQHSGDSVTTSVFSEKYEPHDDAIKWKHFPCYWPFVRGIHRSPVNSLHKDQWRGASMFFLSNNWFSKHSIRWWFETLSRSLWCHCSVKFVISMLDLTDRQSMSSVLPFSLTRDYRQIPTFLVILVCSYMYLWFLFCYLIMLQCTVKISNFCPIRTFLNA